MANEVTKTIVKALIVHLKARMPSLLEAYDDFPNPSQPLKMPGMSVFLRKPNFNPLSTYVLSKGALIASGADTGKYPVKRVVGSYDFNMQVDLWCPTKPSRHSMFQEFFAAFNNNAMVSGLSLQVADYHNQWVRFDMDDPEFVDSQEGSQRNEWRVKIDVLANCKAIVSTNEYLIETIENNLETPDEIESPTEEESGQII